MVLTPKKLALADASGFIRSLPGTWTLEIRFPSARTQRENERAPVTGPYATTASSKTVNMKKGQK
jgi:hypothetical protein